MLSIFFNNLKDFISTVHVFSENIRFATNQIKSLMTFGQRWLNLNLSKNTCREPDGELRMALYLMYFVC